MRWTGTLRERGEEPGKSRPRERQFVGSTWSTASEAAVSSCKGRNRKCPWEATVVGTGFGGGGEGRWQELSRWTLRAEWLVRNRVSEHRRQLLNVPTTGV